MTVRSCGFESRPRYHDTILSLACYEQEINNFSRDLDSYNEQLAALDERQNALDANESALRDKNKRMLSAAEAQYGSDSSEYEQTGGTRLTERKRTARKAPGTGGTNTKA
ncbi:MAG: hypothetical protein QOF61_1435 [Acidobacteriota bacterium]|nr:hypothetical protein [Acidobacteriota bacterium]